MRSIRDCSVCVIGGAGFLGSHLVNTLIDDRGCDVLVIDNLCVGRREWVHPKAHFEHADITASESHLRRLFTGCQFVFNYAAHPYIPDSFARPHHVFEVNANGAIQVINAAQEAGVEAILQVSSAELYGGPIGPANVAHKGRIDETATVQPHSTYGAAKAAVDYYCQAAWRERKTPVIALRQFNCVGERESHPYVVPEIISQLHKQCQSESRKGGTIYWGQGTGKVRLGNNSFRDFLYAGDAVRIAVELLERGQFGEVVNLGSETGTKIYDLARTIGRVLGFVDVTVVEDEARKRPWEIWSLLSSNEKLYQILGYKPVLLPLEDALKRTVTWYQSNGCRWPWESR